MHVRVNDGHLTTSTYECQKTTSNGTSSHAWFVVSTNVMNVSRFLALFPAKPTSLVSTSCGMLCVALLFAKYE